MTVCPLMDRNWNGFRGFHWYERSFLGMFGQRRSHHAVYACVFSTGQKMHLLVESVFVFFFFFKYKYDNLNLILESGAMMPNLAA